MTGLPINLPKGFQSPKIPQSAPQLPTAPTLSNIMVNTPIPFATPNIATGVQQLDDTTLKTSDINLDMDIGISNKGINLPKTEVKPTWETNQSVTNNSKIISSDEEITLWIDKSGQLTDEKSYVDVALVNGKYILDNDDRITSVHNKYISKNFFYNELNNKLFSSSELKKYHLIYSKNIKNIGDLIKIYETKIDEIKNNINNIKLNLDSTISEQNNISFNNKVDNSIYDYKNIGDEILKLKQEKIIFDNTIELIKNFLVMNEKIFNFFVEKKNNVEQFSQYSKKIFNIFKKSISYNLEETSDNNIFLKKLITKLLEINL